MWTGSAIGNRLEAIQALDFVARGLVKCHYKIEKLENLSQVKYPLPPWTDRVLHEELANST